MRCFNEYLIYFYKVNISLEKLQNLKKILFKNIFYFLILTVCSYTSAGAFTTELPTK